MRTKITSAISLVMLVIVLVDCNQLNGIHAAARDGDVSKVRSLLDQNPGLVSAPESAGWTPLHFAAQGGHEEVATVLLARGGDINARLRVGGGTPLHVAATAGRQSIVALLLARGADANATDHDAWTPLHRAAISGNREVAELLLANGGNPYAWSDTSVTPIEQALQNRHGDFARLLRERARATLPFTDGFSGSCQWASGENDSFSFGCDQNAYRLGLKKAGPVQVATNFGWNTPAVSAEVDSSVASGRGLEPGRALLGVGCLTGLSTGYVAILSTDGAWAIMRYSKEFAQLVGNRTGAIAGLTQKNRLRVVCAHENEAATVVSFFVNGNKVGSVRDKPGFARFNGVVLYTDTFPGVVVFERFVAQ